MSEPRTLYLDSGGTPVFAVLHPVDGRPRTAVLLCAPFGYEEICSHRARRAWAQSLAAEGRPALRFDLPATGDSGGAPTDSGLVDAWTDAVADAAAWLRETTGAERVVAAGIGLGGLLAWRAASRGAAIDDLVLWSVPRSGRALVRELRAFSQLGTARPDAPEMAALAEPALPGGAVEAAGFLLAPETVADLGAVDLTALALPAGERRRMLLIGRDGVAVDSRLEAAARAQGAQVECAQLEGFAAMTDIPHHAVPPQEVIAAVERWLATAPAGGAGTPAAAVPATLRTAVIDGVAEEPLELERPDGTRLAAVVTRPGEEPLALCAVLLNAGAERRIGPNRMWVELARRWAARGVTVVRLDVTGIGEASGPAAPWGRDPWTLYETDLVEQVRAALHDLRALGLPERTVLVGLCSGAYWGFQAACSDAHVAAALLFNSRLLVGDRFHGRSYDVPEAWKVASPAHWLRVLRDPEGRAHGLVMLRAVLRLLARAAAQAPVALRARLRARRTGSSSLERALDALRDRGVTLRLLFSPEEPVHRRLEREGTLAQLERWPNLRVEALPGPEAHTLQLVRLERAVHRRLDELLDELLGSAA